MHILPYAIAFWIGIIPENLETTIIWSDNNKFDSKSLKRSKKMSIYYAKKNPNCSLQKCEVVSFFNFIHKSKYF
jgi:hypothetical protein